MGFWDPYYSHIFRDSGLRVVWEGDPEHPTDFISIIQRLGANYPSPYCDPLFGSGKMVIHFSICPALFRFINSGNQTYLYMCLANMFFDACYISIPGSYSSLEAVLVSPKNSLFIDTFDCPVVRFISQPKKSPSSPILFPQPLYLPNFPHPLSKTTSIEKNTAH